MGGKRDSQKKFPTLLNICFRDGLLQVVFTQSNNVTISKHLLQTWSQTSIYPPCSEAARMRVTKMLEVKMEQRPRTL